MAENIDIIKTIYQELFTVRFLHNGYGPPRPNFIKDSISLQPDEATKNFFQNHDIGYRFLNDTLVCFIRCKDGLPRVPYIKFPAVAQIRFFVNATSDFLSKTIVDATGALQMYQFTNQVNIATGGFITMHTEGVNNDDLKNVDFVKADKVCFGVIDIYNSGAVNSSYDLFSGTNQTLKSPGYSIRFISKI